jgi:hypothetical protein
MMERAAIAAGIYAARDVLVDAAPAIAASGVEWLDHQRIPAEMLAAAVLSDIADYLQRRRDANTTRERKDADRIQAATRQALQIEIELRKQQLAQFLSREANKPRSRTIAFGSSCPQCGAKGQSRRICSSCHRVRWR